MALVSDLVKPVVHSVVTDMLTQFAPATNVASEYQVTADGVAVTSDGDPVLASP